VRHLTYFVVPCRTKLSQLVVRYATGAKIRHLAYSLCKTVIMTKDTDRTSIRLDRALLARLRARCQQQGCSLTWAVTKAVEQWLSRPQPIIPTEIPESSKD
jgi:hypothetical protein